MHYREGAAAAAGAGAAALTRLPSVQPRDFYETKYDIGPNSSIEPKVGFHQWPERLNGRWAMMGFVGIVLLELVLNKGLLEFVIPDLKDIR